VNTSEFRHHQSKLGLGSSAAAAVAAAGAVFEHAGLAIASNRELLFTVADDGHRAAQGGLGSGADVAAAVHGGYVGFVRPPNARPVITRLQAPTGLHLIVFWTGTPANTPEMIRAVQALATRSPPSYTRLIDNLRILAERFVHAFQIGDTRGAVAEADAYGRLLERLGAEAGVPIMTPLVAEAADAARALGGTAKPSGAGGGDIGIALFSDESGAWEFARRCPAGISVLDVSVDLGGARRRTAHEVQTL